ncbi:MAG: NAD(P)H-dependent oxidoreductase subunit E [Planctomycetota bacterium]|nr:NAD(P)H-dependent oxidoreductase subunit E [Planctomycetota bacterium]
MADTISFAPKTMKQYKWLLTRYPTSRAALLPTLRLAEEQFGQLGVAEMRYVADLMKIPPAFVYGVVTFYTHYRRAGTGTYHIQVCSTLSCALRGSEDVVRRITDRLGIEPGETSECGNFSLSKVECLGSCDTAPMLQCNDDYHEDLSLEDVDQLIDQLSSESEQGGN